MNSDLKITISREIEKPLQINGTDTETQYINEYLNDYKYLIIHESPKYILLQDIPNQLYDYLEQIDLFPFQGYSTTFQELEYNYNYHIRYKSQVQKIKEQLELKQNQLIKDLILSNQINNINPDQIQIKY